MKTVIRALACAATILAVGSAYAEPQVLGDQNDTVQIKAPAQYKLTNGEFDDYAYTYALENGKRIRFTQRVFHFYAQLEGEAKTELMPQAPGVFMTANGARIQFKEEGDEVAIRNYERLAVSSKLPADTIIIARR